MDLFFDFGFGVMNEKLLLLCVSFNEEIQFVESNPNYDGWDVRLSDTIWRTAHLSRASNARPSDCPPGRWFLVSACTFPFSLIPHYLVLLDHRVRSFYYYVCT